MLDTYNPRCFDVRNITEAKAIILTPDVEAGTDERWAKETPYLADLMGEHLGLCSSHLLLDYGCGIGRLSKAAIERFGCSAVGVDQSVSMRALAMAYVENHRFVACAPDWGILFSAITEVDRAIAVWALQHIPNVEQAIADLAEKMVIGGRLLVVNAHERYLPIDGGKWVTDGKDVRRLLARRFSEEAYGALDPEHTSAGTSRQAFWGVYQRID